MQHQHRLNKKVVHLTPETDDRSRYSTNSRGTRLKFHILEQKKHLISVDNDHTNFSILQAFQHFCHKCKTQFLQTSPNGIFRFLSESIVHLLQENLQEVKKEQVFDYRK